MTKKFLALTMVLVLAAGFAAVAQDRALTGSWENELTLKPQTNPIDALTSDIEVTYNSGGITYMGTVEMDLGGLDEFEAGVETSVGLLDLSSTVNFNPQTPGLDFWKSDATMTLGGVSISDTFLLQDTDATSAGVNNGFGAGMDLMFSGETPGGVSVDVNNYFGMEPLVDSDDDGYIDTGEITGINYGPWSVPYYSGYAIVGQHTTGGPQTAYNPSSMQYVASKLSLEGQSVGCCDFTSTTLFSELNGFEYTEFEFTLESSNLPLSMDGDLKFTPQTKSVDLVPSLTTEWGCFDVYTNLEPSLLGNNSVQTDTISGLEVEGFALTDVDMGHVTLSAYTALGDNTLYDLEGYAFYPHGTSHDEVLVIDKKDEYPLDFTLETFFDMSNSEGLFDLSVFDGSMSYKIDDEFTVGSGVTVDAGSSAGLNEFRLTFDYSF